MFPEGNTLEEIYRSLKSNQDLWPELKDIEIANQLDLRIKLLGISELKHGHLFETVHPCLVSKKSYIGNKSTELSLVFSGIISSGYSTKRIKLSIKTTFSHPKTPPKILVIIFNANSEYS